MLSAWRHMTPRAAMALAILSCLIHIMPTPVTYLTPLGATWRILRLWLITPLGAGSISRAGYLVFGWCWFCIELALLITNSVVFCSIKIARAGILRVPPYSTDRGRRRSARRPHTG